MKQITSQADPKAALALIGAAVASALVVPTAGAPDPALDEGWPILEIAVSVLAIAVAVLQMWISFALAFKRFHDRDRKGWWVLIILIPIIGALWLFVVLGFLKGTEGANRFGPDPLAA